MSFMTAENGRAGFPLAPGSRSRIARGLAQIARKFPITRWERSGNQSFDLIAVKTEDQANAMVVIGISAGSVYRRAVLVRQPPVVPSRRCQQPVPKSVPDTQPNLISPDKPPPRAGVRTARALIMANLPSFTRCDRRHDLAA